MRWVGRLVCGIRVTWMVLRDRLADGIVSHMTTIRTLQIGNDQYQSSLQSTVRTRTHLLASSRHIPPNNLVSIKQCLSSLSIHSSCPTCQSQLALLLQRAFSTSLPSNASPKPLRIPLRPRTQRSTRSTPRPFFRHIPPLLPLPAPHPRSPR